MQTEDFGFTKDATRSNKFRTSAWDQAKINPHWKGKIKEYEKIIWKNVQTAVLVYAKAQLLAKSLNKSAKCACPQE